MGESGGKPDDTIVTLEEALKRFARKRIEDSAETKDAAVQDSKVHLRTSRHQQNARKGSVSRPE